MTLETAPHDALSAAEVRAFFDEHGYAGPFTLMSEEAMETHALALLPRLRQTNPLPGQHIGLVRNRHLDLPEVWRLCTSPPLIERLQAVLGPDLVLWQSHLFYFSRKHKGLHWHTDHYGKLLSEPRNVTLHVQLTAATSENCMLLVPGSHRLTPREAQERYRLPAPDYGHEGTPGFGKARIDRAHVHACTARPGQFFFFGNTLHASSIAFDPDVDGMRVAFVLRVTTPDVQVQPYAYRESAAAGHKPALLAGQDAFGRNDYARPALASP